jgi:hypothetical protein
MTEDEYWAGEFSDVSLSEIAAAGDVLLLAASEAAAPIKAQIKSLGEQFWNQNFNGPIGPTGNDIEPPF